MGDFNAKIGSDNTGYDEVMGRQGLGEMNENGNNQLNGTPPFTEILSTTRRLLVA